MINIKIFYSDDVYSSSLLATLKFVDFNFELIKVDETIAIEYKILKIPQLRAYVNGGEIKKHIGSLTKEDLLKIIEQTKRLE